MVAVKPHLFTTIERTPDILILYDGPGHILKIAAFHGDRGLIEYVVLWANVSPYSKWNINGFSRFCGPRGYDQQTDSQTDRQADRHTDSGTSVTMGRILCFVVCIAMQPSNQKHAL